MNSLLEKILLEFERLIQGNEQNAIVLSLFIFTIGILYLYLVKSYVDPYEKAKKELQDKKLTNPLVSFLVSVKNEEKEIIDCIESMINQTYKNYKILLDPHTAVALGVSKKISLKSNTIILSTAHPAKFPDAVTQETNQKPELPESLKKILNKKEIYQTLPNNLKEVQSFILEKI